MLEQRKLGTKCYCLVYMKKIVRIYSTTEGQLLIEGETQALIYMYIEENMAKSNTQSVNRFPQYKSANQALISISTLQ